MCSNINSKDFWQRKRIICQLSEINLKQICGFVAGNWMKSFVFVCFLVAFDSTKSLQITGNCCFSMKERSMLPCQLI